MVSCTHFRSSGRFGKNAVVQKPGSEICVYCVLINHMLSIQEERKSTDRKMDPQSDSINIIFRCFTFKLHYQ